MNRSEDIVRYEIEEYLEMAFNERLVSLKLSNEYDTFLNNWASYYQKEFQKLHNHGFEANHHVEDFIQIDEYRNSALVEVFNAISDKFQGNSL